VRPRRWIGSTPPSPAPRPPGYCCSCKLNRSTPPGFIEIRERIVGLVAEFGRPVLLTHGDEHNYEFEGGYAGMPNLTRLETFGDTTTEWLRVHVDPRSGTVFSWQPRSVS